MKLAIQLVLLLVVASGCSLRKRALETPVPNEQVVSREYFFKGGDITKPKRFVLGTAPIAMDSSAEGTVSFIMQQNLHVNIEFIPTENSLIGYEVNPSFLDNSEACLKDANKCNHDRSKWSKVIEIPVTKNFYYENRKDEYGREMREMIENDQRGHWSRRTHMKLNLTGTQFFIERELSQRSYSVSRTGLFVDGVEWDKNNSYLGFSINERSTISYPRAGFSTTFNTTSRVNLLAFESDPNFKATAYHVDNAKYFNILHTMGRQIEGGGNRDRQLLKAARWDFSKPLDVYFHNVPEKYIPLFQETLEAWAESLRKIGAVPAGFKPFNVRLDYPSAYPFDLRYTTIHWVDDRRISRHAPLGVALNNADVQTGKMLNANVIIYAGMLESLINRYLSTGAATSALSFVAAEHLYPEMPFNTPDLTGAIRDNMGQYLNTMTQQTMSLLAQQIQQTQVLAKDESNTDALNLLNQLQSQVNNSVLAADSITTLLRDIPNAEISLPQFTGMNLPTFEQSTLGYLNATSSYDLLSLDSFKIREMDLTQALQQEKGAVMNEDEFAITKNAAYHTDRTFANVSPMWMSALDDIPSDRQDAALRSLIRNILLHELGHFLGLGHQFKGTVVPEYGTVPKIYTNHPDNLRDHNSLLYKSLREVEGENGEMITKEPTNYTSIMDYPNGRTEVIIPEKDVVPGFHDELVLRYIYNGQISVYDRNRDRFDFTNTLSTVNEEIRGKIPTEIRGKPVAYFPACNDIDASLLKDPQCNRWDSGSRPVDVVKSYSQIVVDNLGQSLLNLTDTNELSADQAENRLWRQSYDLFTHIRPFYDKLRIKLNETPIDTGSTQSMWDAIRYNDEALFSFSDACISEPEQLSNLLLKKIMRNKEVRELCLANIETLKLVKSLMGLPRVDYTRLRADRYIHGGLTGGEVYTSMDRYFSGDWGELTTYPIKYVALQSIMTSTPLLMYGGWIWPNLFYDYQGNRFFFRTLFPKEVTEITSMAVKENLSFSQLQNQGEERVLGEEKKTLIGQTVLSLAYLNWYSNLGPFAGAEGSRLSDRYLEILQSTTSFNFAPVALIVKAVDPTSGDMTRYKKFTVELYDFNTQKSSQIQNFFILPGRKVIARDSNRFIFPITKLRFYKEKEAFVIAYKVDYEKPGTNMDDLDNRSLRKHLSDLHTTLVEACIGGRNDDTGLASYFGMDGTGFNGFEIQNGMATDTNDAKRNRFDETIDQEFARYETYVQEKNPNLGKSMTVTCNESLKGIGMISAVAAMMNGQWLGMTNTYVER